VAPATFAVVAASVAVAAFVQGTIGVGFALIVAPILAFTAPALLPVCVLVLMLPLNIYVAWRERGALDRSGAAWITAGRLVGTFGGLWILVAIPASALSFLVGAATILAAGATLVAPPFRAGPRAFASAGLVTGVTETATGIGGPPLALVYQHHAPETLRATLALCFLVGQVLSLAVLAVAGRVSAAQFGIALLLMPPLVLGAVASRHLHRRVGGRVLRVFVLAFAIVSGVVLLLRP
jgi:uncharacterized membrane protein YfcA